MVQSNATIKDPAMFVSNFPRKELDFYPTPAWCSEAVMHHLRELRPSDTPVWECASGDGAMVEVLKKYYNNVSYSDINNYGYPGTIHIDFLNQNYAADMIVTNPPYGDLAEKFIRKALACTEPRKGLVTMFLRNDYDTAGGRQELFDRPPFARQVLLTTRPRWIEGSTGGAKALLLLVHLGLDTRRTA